MTRYLLRATSFAVIALLTLPVLAGLGFVLAPAFGISELVEAHGFGLTAFKSALSVPGMAQSIWLSFWIGPVTALIALALAILFTAAFGDTRLFQIISAAMRPILAVPHAAAAFGLAFLLAPSGFILRLISPALTGFQRPPDWLVINDPAGYALLLGLVVKELPFLFLVTFAALPQTEQRARYVAQGFGHGRIWSFLVTLFPGIYKQIRLPVLSVIVFACAVVDVAMILGPGTPPPLAVRILHWMNDPDLSRRQLAAAAAVIQLGVSTAAVLVWLVFEQLIARIGRHIVCAGWRLRRDHWLRLVVGFGAGASAALVLGGIGVLALWSVSGLWQFPNAFPSNLNLHTWIKQAPDLIETTLRAGLIGVMSAGISIILVIACLENEYRMAKKLSAGAKLILFLPLLVPQIAFLAGLSTLLLRFGIDGTIWAVTAAHMVFVLPYVYLTLSDPWNAFDTRYLFVARSLGQSANQVLLRVRLPMLLGPILTALALGFAISIAQYLPTLLIGAGRQPTITTEAVALASGGNRRVIGAYVLLETLLPFIGFALAAMLPAWLWRNRRGLRPVRL